MALLQGITNWLTKPTATPESTQTPNAGRFGKYNEAAVLPYYVDQYPTALEGSYFLASSPAPGTGVAMTTSLTAYASGSTKPYILIANNNVPGGPNIELDYLKMILASQLPTTATNMQIAISLDLAANKVPTTAGTAVVPVNTNPASTNATKAAVQDGAITTAADSGSVVLLYQDYMEPIVTTTPCAVLGDQFYAKFGSLDHNSGTGATGQVAAGTPLQTKMVSSSGPPIVIPPGWCACVKVYGTALAAAPAFSWELGYRER